MYIHADTLTEWAQKAVIDICNRMGWTATSTADRERIEISYPEADADMADFIFGEL